MIFAGTHQERCEIAANKCQCCHSGCAVTQRQSPAQCSDQRHYDECQALRKHVVKAEGGVECKVENRHAKRGNRLIENEISHLVKRQRRRQRFRGGLKTLRTAL